MTFSFWQHLYWLKWKALQIPLRQSLALAALISIGDYGVISIFGSQDFQTLLGYLARLLGGYQVQKGQAIVLIMLFIYMLIFLACERGRHD